MKKTLVVLMIFSIISILSSCLSICKDKRYIDFNNIAISIKATKVQQNDSLSFNIRMTDGVYLGLELPKINLISSAFALDCDEGSGGLKYPLTKIEISSDSDFNGNYPANTILNELVSIDAWMKESGKVKNMKLEEVDISDNYEGQMHISERPLFDKEHVLTITLFKSDGKVIEAKTENIIWN